MVCLDAQNFPVTLVFLLENYIRRSRQMKRGFFFSLCQKYPKAFENIFKAYKNHQETAVIIEKEIKRLNSYENIDPFINLCGFYHLNRCEMDTDSLYCRFICTLTIYLILWMA